MTEVVTALAVHSFESRAPFNEPQVHALHHLHGLGFVCQMADSTWQLTGKGCEALLWVQRCVPKSQVFSKLSAHPSLEVLREASTWQLLVALLDAGWSLRGAPRQKRQRQMLTPVDSTNSPGTFYIFGKDLQRHRVYMMVLLRCSGPHSLFSDAGRGVARVHHAQVAKYYEAILDGKSDGKLEQPESEMCNVSLEPDTATGADDLLLCPTRRSQSHVSAVELPAPRPVPQVDMDVGSLEEEVSHTESGGFSSEDSIMFCSMSQKNRWNLDC